MVVAGKPHVMAISVPASPDQVFFEGYVSISSPSPPICWIIVKNVKSLEVSGHDRGGDGMVSSFDEASQRGTMHSVVIPKAIEAYIVRCLGRRAS